MNTGPGGRHPRRSSRRTAGQIRAVYTDHELEPAIGRRHQDTIRDHRTTALYQGGLPAGVPFTNQYGFDDPEMNRLIAAGATELDEARRVEIYNATHAAPRRAPAVIPLGRFPLGTVRRRV